MVLRSILSFVISYSLAFFPMHSFAAQNSYAVQAPLQQEALRSFVKDSGIGQENTTVAQWIKKNKAYFHPKVAELASQWAAKNPNFKMPKVKMTSFQGENGQETTRLVFQEKKETTTMDIVTQGDKVTLSIDGKKYSFNDIYYDGALEEAADSSQVTWNELSRVHKLSPKKAALYQASLRNAVDALTAFQQNNVAFSPRKTSFIDMLLEQAYAVANGTRCIMAGYATVQKGGSCGGGEARLHAGCVQGTVNCNPTVYGYAADGKNFCVPQLPATDVSLSCDKQYPIPGSEQGLVDSVIKNVNSQKPEDRDAAWGKFFTDLESDISTASTVCMGEGSFDFEKFKSIIKSEGPQKAFHASDFESQFPVKMSGKKDENLHQRLACETVMNRLFYMDQAKTCVRGSIAESDAGVPQSKTDSAECKYAEAQTFAADMGSGVVKTEPLPEDKVVPVPAPVKEKKSKKWLLWIVAGLGAACLFKIICGSKDKKPKPTYPPIPVGKPGETETPRGGYGGVGAPMPTATTMPPAPAARPAPGVQ